MTKAWRCPECDSPLIEASNKHSICPNGHGKIGYELPRAVKMRNHAIVSLGLRDARLAHDGTYQVPGYDGRYGKLRRINRVLNSWPVNVPKSHVLAFDDKGVIELEIIDEEKM